MLSTAFTSHRSLSIGANWKPRCRVATQRARQISRSEPSDKVSVTADSEVQEGSSDVCKACGAKLSEMPRTCDGQGRLLGGIGSVPGFGWWPIKAYRECPTGAKRGVQYKRKGQITDEVLFGRGQQ